MQSCIRRVVLVNRILKRGVVLAFVVLFSGLVFVGLVSCGEVVCFELEFPRNGTWIISIPVLFDWYSLVFFLVVLIISACVMVYRVAYMQHEVYLKRFGDLVMLFVLSIRIYVFIPNFIGLMVG